MPDEYTQNAGAFIDDRDDDVFSAVERDARRYSRAFEEEEEARLN